MTRPAPGRDEFGFLEIGINPAVRLPKDGPGRPYLEAGTIALGTGNIVWAGGDNKASFEVDCLLLGGILQIDGKALVRDGTFQVTRRPTAGCARGVCSAPGLPRLPEGGASARNA
jgi:hypothetical protein